MGNRPRCKCIKLFRYEVLVYEPASCVPHPTQLLVTASRRAQAEEIVKTILKAWREAGKVVYSPYLQESRTFSRNKARLVMCL